MFVRLPDFKCIINSVYFPPTSNTIHYDRYTELFEDIYISYPEYDVLNVGDFNLPDVRWNVSANSEYIQFCDDKCDSLTKNNLLSLNLSFSNYNINQFNNITIY